LIKIVSLLACFLIAFQCIAQKSDFDYINFQKADRIALECKNDGLDNLPELAYQLTSQLDTDVERFRAIYRWVCNNIANDYKLYKRNMRKRQRFKNDSLKLTEWNNRFRKLSFKTLLEDQKTICTGYAYLVKELSKLANINCEVVNGYAKTSTINTESLDMPNHSWNAVELNGKWYLCDSTWASGTPNPESLHFEFNYNDGFFLAEPKLFAVNHYPEDTKWLLLNANQPTFQDFLDAPIIYGKTYNYLSAYLKPTKLHYELKKNEPLKFKCQLLKAVDKKEVYLLIDNGSDSKKVHPKNSSITNNHLTIEHSFDRNGFYDVHLFIGLDLIATHTVRVKG
jgi:transglutaminase/protease-like cytokinesis protein 3